MIAIKTIYKNPTDMDAIHRCLTCFNRKVCACMEIVSFCKNYNMDEAWITLEQNSIPVPLDTYVKVFVYGSEYSGYACEFEWKKGLSFKIKRISNIFIDKSLGKFGATDQLKPEDLPI